MTKKNEVEVFDTTLRDGGQSPDVNFSLRDKIEIVQVLDELGVDFIEIGWPGSNPKDMECFLQASKLNLKNAKIVAFGSTKRAGIKANEDTNLKAILDSKVPVACIFGKTWIEHVEKQLKCTRKENLNCITESVKFLKKNGLEVIYDLEHFFDGYKDNSEYAYSCIKAATDAGARTVVLCDTNGGCLPTEVAEITTEVISYVKNNSKDVVVGVHMHNDSGCGAANSIVAVSAGARHVQGSINGIGERTGNADLCSIIPGLSLKLGFKLTKLCLDKLSKTSNFVYTLANLKANARQPYVGRNAFAHKGGIHVDAVMKGASYEHIKPELIGNKRNIILSELSGKANIVEVAKKYGYNVEKNDPHVATMLKDVEELEKKGYDIGCLDSEQYLLVKKHFEKNEGPFELSTWRVSSEIRNGEYSECVVTGKVDGKDREVVAPVDGGPVEAIFKSLKKIVATNYSKIKEVKLVNYKVMIAEDSGAESSVRVFIEFSCGKDEWGTTGVSENILEASMEAIEKGFRYYLIRNLSK